MNFSWDIYRELNPDLIKAGLKTKSDFENHYKENGRREKRAFHLYQKYPDFNPLHYKSLHRDLQSMTISQLEIHWLFHGRHENRSYLLNPNPIKEVYKVQTVHDYENAAYEAVRESIPPSNVCVQDNKKDNINEPIKKRRKERKEKILQIPEEKVIQEPIIEKKESIKVIEEPVIEKKEPIVKAKELKKEISIKVIEEPVIEKKEPIIKEVVQKVKSLNTEITNMVSSELNSLGLYHIYISNDLKHLDRICPLYNLTKSNDYSVPLIVFGLYNRDDYKVVNQHKSKIYIMWGGTDEMMLSQYTVQMLISSQHIYHIAISKDIHNRLLSRGFDRVQYVNLDLTNYSVFKPVDKKGYKIFIYNGYNKGQEDKYGKMIYDQIINKLPEYEYIFSNELGGIPNEQMYDIYKQCFIGLRLTTNDGNANMVGELKAMDIPVIHNISEYGLKWSTVDDVIRIIKEHRNSGTSLDFYNNSLEEGQLEIIKENIDNFTDSIRTYRNILFISSDYPGYGGAATNCYRLQQFFGMEHQVYGIYYNFKGEQNRKIESNPQYCVVDEDKVEVILKTMRFRPDLIILKSFVNTINVKSVVNCPVYYFIPGIFLNTLNKYYSEIKSKDEMDSFINKSVLKQIMNSDKSFCNSNHTRMLLKKNYNITTGLFYSSFVNEYNNLQNSKLITIKNLDFNKRKYTYGIICSNFNRCIKNVSASILALKNKKDVVLIGKESKQFLSYGFTCIESIPHSEMPEYYKQIKYIVQDSFYESCSNVKVEALFNGCKVINSNSDIIIKDKVKKEINLLDKKDIYVLDTYREETHENLCKTIEYFDQLGIRLYYLLLSKKTQLLNKYNHRIRIQDNTKIYQIENIINKWLKGNVEQIFYANDLETSMSEVINIFRNKNVLIDKIFQSIVNKNIKIFINFKCSNVPYGGGNQFIMNLVEFLGKVSNIKVTYDLEEGIDIYFIVDIRKGPFKKYSFDEIYQHKQINGGFIIYRINDCSITRLNCKLESIILENVNKIDHFIFNSTFIHDYYTDKYDDFKKKSVSIIYNTANSNFFYPKEVSTLQTPSGRKGCSNHWAEAQCGLAKHTSDTYPKGCSSDTYPKGCSSDTYPKKMLSILPKKLKIVTHHWSDNINKGYEIYYQLYQYCKGRNDIELVIFGRKFADGFVEPPPVCGPYKGKELGDMLRECDIYISASKYDSCPMHILEGISCGLPILYLDHSGGVKDICEMADDVIGEGFKNIEECIKKIDLIKSNYEMYYKNIIKNIDLYHSNQCYADYTKLFLNSVEDVF
jgi:hypothetical protein